MKMFKIVEVQMKIYQEKNSDLWYKKEIIYKRR